MTDTEVAAVEAIITRITGIERRRWWCSIHDDDRNSGAWQRRYTYWFPGLDENARRHALVLDVRCWWRIIGPAELGADPWILASGSVAGSFEDCVTVAWEFYTQWREGEAAAGRGNLSRGPQARHLSRGAP